MKKNKIKKPLIILAIVLVIGVAATITTVAITNKPASASAGWEVTGVLEPFGQVNSYLNDTVCSADKDQNIWTYHGSDDIWKFERLDDTNWGNKVRVKTPIIMRNILVNPNNTRNGIGITRDDYKLYQGTSGKGGTSWRWDRNSFDNWPQLIDASAVWKKTSTSIRNNTSPSFIYGMRHSDSKIIGAAYPFDNPQPIEGIREGNKYGIGVSPDGKQAIVAVGIGESNLYEYDIDSTGMVFSNERQILIDEQPQLFPTYLSQNELFFSIDTPKYGLDVWLAKDRAAEIDSLNLK